MLAVETSSFCYLFQASVEVLQSCFFVLYFDGVCSRQVLLSSVRQRVLSPVQKVMNFVEY